MVNIIVLLIMAGCAAYQFLKGTLFRAFGTFMAALCAAIVAFAWFEQLANLLQGMFSDWAQPICFVVLFIVTFAVLLTIVILLTREPIDLGVMAERAGRIVLGLLLGLILSGSLLTAASMAPIPSNYPYPRFDRAANAQSPRKLLLNPDGFITRWFSIISSGSLGGSKSFAVLHADFLDQLFLNRFAINKGISVFATSNTVELPPKAAVWPAPEGLKDNKGNAIDYKIKCGKTECELIMARLGLTARTKTFTPSQLRLICKKKGGKQRLQGSAVNIYPIGYLRSPGQLQRKGPADQIRPEPQTQWIDFAFYLPVGLEPVAVAVKANAIAEVPPIVTAEEVPKPIPFIQNSDCVTLFAKVVPATSAKIYGLELASGDQLLKGAALIVSDIGELETMQAQSSIKPAQIDRGQITCARAEFKVQTTPSEPDQQPRETRLNWMLKPADGYSLLSLKCNTPAVGSVIRGEQLPVLIDNFGIIHRPCGLLAAGKTGDVTTFEFDYCSLTGDASGEITLDDNGAVAKPFPETVWLTEQAESISQFYVLYMVKTGTVILSVQPAGARVGTAFDGAEAFLVR